MAVFNELAAVFYCKRIVFSNLEAKLLKKDNLSGPLRAMERGRRHAPSQKTQHSRTSYAFKRDNRQSVFARKTLMLKEIRL